MSKKRKRPDDDDDVLELATGSGESGTNPNLLKKKIREEVRINSEEEDDGEIVPLTNGGGQSSSFRLNGYIGPSHDDLEPQTNGTDLWLIRKPKNVPIEEVYKLRFTKKSKYSRQEFCLNDDPQQSFECHLEEPGFTILHSQTAHGTSINQKPTMKFVGNLEGTIRINQQNQTTDDHIEQSSQPNEDIFFKSEGDEPAPPIHFSPIRRIPKVEGNELKERLKAYGHEPAKQRRKK